MTNNEKRNERERRTTWTMMEAKHAFSALPSKRPSCLLIERSKDRDRRGLALRGLEFS